MRRTLFVYFYMGNGDYMLEEIIINSETVEEDVLNYWTIRTPSFSKIRENEIMGDIGKGWHFALRSTLPIRKYRKILDIGTGTGFFSVLLGRDGYRMTGVDLTPSMIEEAKREAKKFNSKAEFFVMDAQNLEFEDESFDAIITRNLTWTLPDVEKAYNEWFRVLRPGGRLINYDANYANAIRKGDVARTESGDKKAYGHDGVTKDMEKMCNDIALSLEIGKEDRPAWDKEILQSIGFRKCFVDMDEAENILGLKSDPAAPMFKIIADK